MPFHQKVHDDNLTGRIIGCAIEVHNALGPHKTEDRYRDALSIVLEDEGIQHEVEYEYPLTIRDTPFGTGRTDLMVEGEVALELKALKRTTDNHFAQAVHNTKRAGASRGLLLNFGTPQLDIRRIANDEER